MHVKMLLCDVGLVIGSTNFTEASQQNEERGVIVDGHMSTLLEDEVRRVDGLFERAPKFWEGLGDPLPATPPRSA